MKTKLIILVLIPLAFVTLKTHAQDYLISFAGTGAATTVDSVLVEDVTNIATVKLHNGDILHLVNTTGINNITTNDENIQVIPNPMQGQAEISFYAAKSGDAQLIIYDLLGKEISQINDNFSQGIQKFQLSGLTQGVYFINVSGGNYSYKSKIISLNTIQSEVKIIHLGSSLVNGKREAASQTSESKSKSTKATIAMAYTTGDYIRFTGYSATYHAIVVNVPTSSKTITFNFSTDCGTVTDADNNIYNTVTIGDQCWMKKNINTTKYNNNSPISNLTSPSAWANCSNTSTGAYCNLDNNQSNGDVYGRLYNWYAVNSGNLCPGGWHVATEPEWITLATYLGDINKIKEAGTAHWSFPNTATNESGFTALPGKHRDGAGTFNLSENKGLWWTSTGSGGSAFYIWINAILPGEVNDNSLSSGYSVRCLKGDICTDGDGYNYHTVTIGTQTWMAENLKATKYNDGTNISNGSGTAWEGLAASSTAAYCDYNNTPNDYGHLYNGYAAESSKLCPAGWHIPTKDEWRLLGTYLGDDHSDEGNWTGTSALALREAGPTHWVDANNNNLATNSTGFTAIPGGSCVGNNNFQDIGERVTFWSSTTTADEPPTLYNYYIRNQEAGQDLLYEDSGDLMTGFSIRCLKN